MQIIYKQFWNILLDKEHPMADLSWHPLSEPEKPPSRERDNYIKVLDMYDGTFRLIIKFRHRMTAYTEKTFACSVMIEDRVI